jgi:hypothetical protein
MGIRASYSAQAAGGRLLAVWSCLFAAACSGPAQAGFSSQGSAVRGASPRLEGLLTRPATRRAEIALLLQEMLAVARRTTSLGLTHAQGEGVLDLARQVDLDLTGAGRAFAQYCTEEHAQSAVWETVVAQGQDVVTALKSKADQAQASVRAPDAGARQADASEPGPFDADYLRSVSALGSSFVELLDHSTDIDPNTPEAQQLTQFRWLLSQHQQRAQALLQDLR